MTAIAVASGTPVSRSVPKNTSKVAIAVSASGGVINVTYTLGDIDIPWSVGEVADGGIASTLIDFPVDSFTVTGDGTFEFVAIG